MTKICNASIVFMLGFEECKLKSEIKKSNSWVNFNLVLDMGIEKVIESEKTENKWLLIQSSSSSRSGGLNADNYDSLYQIPIPSPPPMPKNCQINSKRRLKMPLKRLKVIDD